MIELQRIARTNTTMLLRPGVTIWRPVFRGKLWNPRIIESATGDCNFVKTKYASRSCFINEPQVSEYNEPSNMPYGITTFLLDEHNEPAKTLPANWYGLEVISISRNGQCVYARPLVSDEIRLYVSFRHEIAKVFGDVTLATNLDFIQDLPRLYVQESPDRREYIYGYFK